MEMPVVRVELLGGLGNQLFQAATGFALAKRLGARLELDVARFRAGGVRAYALAGLPHGATVVGENLSTITRLTQRARRVMTFGRSRRPAGWSGSVFREASYAYDQHFESLSGSCFLTGYFQSARYFAHYEAEIRAAFGLETVASEKALRLAKTMAENTLAVHIRIGDFKAQNQFNDVHGTLTPRYYRDAIALVTAARQPDHILVFTDTPDAVASLMPEGVDYTLVSGHSAADDLFLMSQARHHIIANSTFSWWSAWLAPQSDTMVVAPRAWFTPEELKKTYVGDLYPEGWVLL